MFQELHPHYTILLSDILLAGETNTPHTHTRIYTCIKNLKVSYMININNNKVHQNTSYSTNVAKKKGLQVKPVSQLKQI